MGFVLGSVYEASATETVAGARSLMLQKTLRFKIESRVLQALASVEAGVGRFDACSGYPHQRNRSSPLWIKILQTMQLS